MKTQHTPGPWYFLPDRNGRLQVGPSINYTVAEMCVTPLEGQEANARLIATAPELLEALQEIMSWEENEQMTWAQKARAAITKATGETK